MAAVAQRAPPTTAVPMQTLTSGTNKVQYMVMTSQALQCPPPILTDEFEYCRVPGGFPLWAQGGFYSPGVCFIGYEAMCTQTDAKRLAWPIRPGETVVRCIPSGYECNDIMRDQKYATSSYGTTILSAPAFEIRWRSQDLEQPTGPLPPPGVQTRSSTPTKINSSVATVSSGIKTSPTTSSTVGSQPNKPASSDQSHPQLTTPAVAGIIVGSLAGICLLVFLVIFTKRHYAKTHADEEEGTESSFSRAGPNMQEESGLGRGPPSAPMELSAEDKPVELSSGKPQRESQVPGQWRRSHISVNKIPVEMAA